MECVASRELLRIDVRGRDEVGSPVTAEQDLPIAVVDEPMMGPAEEHAVVEVCPAAEQPADPMMNFAPLWRPITARERATAIAENDSGTSGVAPQAAATAHVEDRSAAVEHGRDDPRVAGDPPESFSRQHLAVVEISDPVAATSQRPEVEQRFHTLIRAGATLAVG